MTLAAVLYTLCDDTLAKVCRRYGLAPIGPIGEPWTVVVTVEELRRQHITLRVVLEGLTDDELVLAQRIAFSGEPLAWVSRGKLTEADRDYLIEMIENHPDPVLRAR